MTKSNIGFILVMAISSSSFAQSHALDYFLHRALTNSPLLYDYQNQVQSNRVDSLRVRAVYKPHLTGSSINSYAPLINGFGYDQAITNGGNFNALVLANKTLVSKRNLNTQLESIQLQSQSVQNTAKISEQELKKIVTAQYITTYGDIQQLHFNREIYDLLHKEEIVLKRLTANNVYRQTDYLAFLVTLQQQELLYKQLQIQFKNDFATLNYLCGITDTAAVSLAAPVISLYRLPDLARSAFFRQFEIDSLKLTNYRALVDFSYRPKANLYADAGFNSSFAYTPYKNFGASFGVSLTVPIYDGRQRKLLYQKIGIAEDTRNRYKTFFTHQYQQQIAQLTQQLLATEELIDQINEQIKYAEGLITANGKLLETGDAKIADYIIALGNYLNARNLLAQNRITRLQIINQINYWNR